MGQLVVSTDVEPFCVLRGRLDVRCVESDKRAAVAVARVRIPG